MSEAGKPRPRLRELPLEVMLSVLVDSLGAAQSLATVDCVCGAFARPDSNLTRTHVPELSEPVSLTEVAALCLCAPSLTPLSAALEVPSSRARENAGSWCEKEKVSFSPRATKPPHQSWKRLLRAYELFEEGSHHAGRAELASTHRALHGADGTSRHLAEAEAAAVAAFEAAAEFGHAPSLYALARFLEKMEARKRLDHHDPAYLAAMTEVRRLMRRSAEQGFIGARVALAGMYDTGLGMGPRTKAQREEDARQAASWLRAAALQGDSEAQFRLALMYSAGRAEVEGASEAQMRELSDDLLRRAASQNHKSAQRSLRLQAALGLVQRLR